jgi:hypothetical protein|tara:strand:+ start:1070 stop:1288 length:219 start_codon:yes stop_codon:yes gene_type:complete
MTDNFINTGIINSYELIMGEKTIDEIVERSKMPIFFIPPDEDYDNDDLDTMIEYFVSTEEYEKCSVLTRLKK